MTITQGYTNYGHSIRCNNDVFTPNSAEELIEFVKHNAVISQPRPLRVFSAGHSYGEVVVGNKDSPDTVLINLTKFNKILSIHAGLVRVQPGVQMLQLLTELEKQNKSLINMTGCLDLSIGGIFNAASHGSGYKPTIADFIESVLILKSDGTQELVHRTDPRFVILAGSMGSCCIILELTLSTIDSPPLLTQSHFTIASKDVQKHIESIDFNQPGVYDYGFWIPIVNKIIFLQIRSAPFTGGANQESVLGKISDLASPSAAKAMDSLRRIHFLSPHLAFSALYTFFNAAASTYPTKNTLFRLAAPESKLAVRINKYFQASQDCEIFYPFECIADALRINNFLFRVMSGDLSYSAALNEPEAKEIDALFSEALSDLKTCINQATIFTAPIEIRFLPATQSALMAPNYNRNVMAVSFGWFGQTKNLPFYERGVTLIMKIAMLKFGAKFHMGKFHPLPNVSDEWMGKFQDLYHDQLTKVKQLSLEMDPQGLLQNRFTREFIRTL